VDCTPSRKRGIDVKCLPIQLSAGRKILEKTSQVQFIQITEKYSGQRLDNFLIRELKGVPRARIYRLVRRGEVRINKKRAKPESRLVVGDKVRIPPLVMEQPGTLPKPSLGLINALQEAVLFEDDDLLVLNKPAGLAVHLGSGIRLGLIEAVRQIQPAWGEAELAHRLDRDTSGALVLCKNMNALRELQAQFKAKTVNKRYHALVQGSWPAELLEIDAPLQRVLGGSGERFVRVSKEGKPSKTSFAVLERFSVVTLLEARPQTGRTHQIRVHCQYAGHPILGDEKYAQNSDKVAKNPQAEAKYLCLHAAEITFKRPGSEAPLTVQAPWDKTFAAQVARIRKKLSNSD